MKLLKDYPYELQHAAAWKRFTAANVVDIDSGSTSGSGSETLVIRIKKHRNSGPGAGIDQFTTGIREAAEKAACDFIRPLIPDMMAAIEKAVAEAHIREANSLIPDAMAILAVAYQSQTLPQNTATNNEEHK